MTAILLSVEYAVGNGTPEPTLTRLVTALERAGDAVADVGKYVLPKVLPVLETETAKQFEAEGRGPASGSWAPLSTSYAAWKGANFPGQPINVLSGKLRGALTDGGAPGARRDVGGDSLTYGTTGIPYASFPQTGTRRMPARPPIDFGDDFEEGLQAAALAGVREAVRAGSEGLLDFEGDEFEGQQVLTGRSGGRYVPAPGGGRTYLNRNASGAVVRRTFGGSR